MLVITYYLTVYYIVQYKTVFMYFRVIKPFRPLLHFNTRKRNSKPKKKTCYCFPQNQTYKKNYFLNTYLTQTVFLKQWLLLSSFKHLFNTCKPCYHGAWDKIYTFWNIVDTMAVVSLLRPPLYSWYNQFV